MWLGWAHQSDSSVWVLVCYHHQGAVVKPRPISEREALYWACNSLIWYNHVWNKNVFNGVGHVQGPPGQKGEQGATEIIDYNGNIQEALQVGSLDGKDEGKVIPFYFWCVYLPMNGSPSSLLTCQIKSGAKVGESELFACIT